MIEWQKNVQLSLPIQASFKNCDEFVKILKYDIAVMFE